MWLSTARHVLAWRRFSCARHEAVGQFVGTGGDRRCPVRPAVRAESREHGRMSSARSLPLCACAVRSSRRHAIVLIGAAGPIGRRPHSPDEARLAPIVRTPEHVGDGGPDSCFRSRRQLALTTASMSRAQLLRTLALLPWALAIEARVDALVGGLGRIPHDATSSRPLAFPRRWCMGLTRGRRARGAGFGDELDLSDAAFSSPGR